MPNPFRALAESIARAEAPEARKRFIEAAAARSLPASDEAADSRVASHVRVPVSGALDRREPRGRRRGRARDEASAGCCAYRRGALALIGDMTDEMAVRSGLRVFARRERLRVAARELLPHAGSDIDVTSRELPPRQRLHRSRAERGAGWADARFGVRSKTSRVSGCGFVVFGMGKLGGRELNAGSDVDLLLLYDTDDGARLEGGAPGDARFTSTSPAFAQRFTATLSDVTEDGFVWRVDLRLQARGGARAARKLAGRGRAVLRDVGAHVGARGARSRAARGGRHEARAASALAALAPFVWRREVDPALADEMIALTGARARAEAASNPERNLKLGGRGDSRGRVLRAVAAADLGGREPSVRVVEHARRAPASCARAARHRPRGARDGRRVPRAPAARAPRPVRHGLQTHCSPRPVTPLLEASSRGRSDSRQSATLRARPRADAAACRGSLRLALARGARRGARARRVRARSSTRSTRRRERHPRVGGGRVGEAWRPPKRFRSVCVSGPRAPPPRARAPPDYPLGAATRDKFPELAPVLLEALSTPPIPSRPRV